MKIAVLADIHANYTALVAVAADIDVWAPDAVVIAGDTINRGPRSRDCLDFILERHRCDGWAMLRGNHEDYVIGVARDPSARPGLDGAIRENVRWTARQVGDVTPLASLGDSVSLYGPDGSEVRVTHASMHSNRDNMFATTPDEQMRLQIAPPPVVFCSGHTHLPFIRTLDDTLVVNVGSAGLPFDGDRRGCYARLTWSSGAWTAELVRVPYDWARAAEDYVTTGFLSESGPAAGLIFDEFRTARSRLFRWLALYETPVLEGQLTVDESLQLYQEHLAASS